MEHEAPEEELLVDRGTDNDTPHFHFISFQLIFTSTILLIPKVNFSFFKNNFYVYLSQQTELFRNIMQNLVYSQFLMWADVLQLVKVHKWMGSSQGMIKKL